MNVKLKEILLRRKNILVADELNQNITAVELTLIARLMYWGYMLNLNHKITNESIQSILKDYEPLLKKSIGADKNYKPFYPNFPEQVMEADDIELFLNAINHYLTNGKWRPNYKINKRLPFNDDVTFTILNIENETNANEILKDILKNLLESKIALSKCDLEDIATLTEYYKLPIDCNITLKETKSFLGAIFLERFNDDIYNLYDNATMTDILRLYTAVSKGDITLSTNSKFKSLPRKQRKMLIQIILNTITTSNPYNIYEDLFRYREKWVRIIERLHIFEYKIPIINSYFKSIYDIKKYNQSFNSLLEKSYKEKNLDNVLKILKTKPTMLVRNFTRILKVFQSEDTLKILVTSLKEVIDIIPVNPILRMLESLENITKKRTVITKKVYSTITVIEPVFNKNPYPEDIWTAFIQNIKDILIDKLQKNDYFHGKKVYIDTDIQNYLMPMAQRGSSKSNRLLSIGSKIPVEVQTNTLRFFVYWENIPHCDYDNQRVDIDLSCIVLNENFECTEHISYTNLRGAFACHSGDITNAPIGVGASEFIDLNIEILDKENYRYFLFNVYSFTGQPFDDIPILYMGYMERQKINSGEIYEPKSVKFKADLNGKITNIVTYIYDSYENKLIWANTPLKINDFYLQNVESSLNSSRELCKSIVNSTRMNMYEFSKYCVGDNLVENPVDADIIVCTYENKDDIISITNEKDIQYITQHDLDIWQTML